MATKIVTKNSSTASAVPTASDLLQGELAVNVADKRLFTEDNAGAIVELGTNPSTLTVTGEITANGGIALGDNDKATFGDAVGGDLQIYHDATNSYIDSNTGRLYVTAASSIRLTNSDNTENYARFNEDGSVQLYYDNAQKFATTSAGIDVTGTATMDGLTVDNTGGSSSAVTVAGNDQANVRLTLDNNGAGGNEWEFVGGLHGANNSALTVYDKTNTAKRAAFANNGDISFYEDTGTTPKFFWDASAESLGIGTSSPSAEVPLTAFYNNTSQFHFGGAQSGISNNTYYNGSTWVNRNASVGGSIFQMSTSGAFNFRRAGTGANPTVSYSMTLDGSGNLLVGKTAAGFANTGHELRGGGSYAAFTRDGGTPVLVNRKSSDGTLVEYMKDGTTVGSIGASGGDLVIGTGDTGIHFHDGVDSLIPWNVTTASYRDAAIDLGTSTYRFKDLYLSGGVVFGATGGSVSSKTLDDYEEGTFTPTVTSGVTSPAYTSQSGSYTKIGNLVYFQFRLDLSSGTAAVSQFKFGGLPFTSQSAANYGGAWISYSAGFLDDFGTASWHIGPSNTEVFAYEPDGSIMTGTELDAIGDVLGNVYVNGVYRV